MPANPKGSKMFRITQPKRWDLFVLLLPIMLPAALGFLVEYRLRETPGFFFNMLMHCISVAWEIEPDDI
jgi:hypothetical protein